MAEFYGIIIIRDDKETIASDPVVARAALCRLRYLAENA